MRPTLVSVVLFLSLGSASAQQTKHLTIGAQAWEASQGGRYAEALRLGRVEVRQYPKDWLGYRTVAWASVGLDRPDDAEAAFRQALRLAPPDARPALQNGLRGVAPLRLALREVARAQALKKTGDTVGSARAWEAAYRAMPTRPAYGIAAAETFESATMLVDAERLIGELRSRSGAAVAVAPLRGRVSALEARIDMDRREAKEAFARDEADRERLRIDSERRSKARRAQTEMRKRDDAAREAERVAEETRQRDEKARTDQAETDRLNGVLDGKRRDLATAESGLKSAHDAADEAERATRKLEHEASEARERRDKAKREKEALEDKLRDTKGDLPRQIVQNDLRGAENAYHDAKDEYERIDRRVDEAKARLAQAQSDADDARRRLEGARSDVRDTETALAKIVSGA